MTRANKVIGVIAVALVVGAVLMPLVGSSFVFFYRQQYTSFAWWAFMLVLPAFAIGMCRERARNPLLVRDPAWWFQWLLMYPLIVVPSAAVVFIGPIGWIAAVTLATGSNTEPTLGHLVSVEEYDQSSKSCDQRGTLVIHEHAASICLEGLTALPAKANSPVIVTGKLSLAGLVVARIAPQ